MRMLFCSLALCWGSILPAAASAADAVPALTYLHLYSDNAGVSHFKPGTLDFKQQHREGRIGPMGHVLASAEGSMFLRLEPGAVEDWHTAPRKWFLIAVQGISEVTASDGEKRQLTPGMILLMDDTTGKGHRTRALGKEAHVAIVIPIKE